MPFGRPHKFPTSCERERDPRNPDNGGGGDGNGGQREQCSAFSDITIPTAVCDVCNRRNTDGIMRCVDCGWQVCVRCARARNGGSFTAKRVDESMVRGVVSLFHVDGDGRGGAADYGDSDSDGDGGSGSGSGSGGDSDSDIMDCRTVVENPSVDEDLVTINGSDAGEGTGIGKALSTIIEEEPEPEPVDAFQHQRGQERGRERGDDETLLMSIDDDDSSIEQQQEEQHNSPTSVPPHNTPFPPGEEGPRHPNELALWTLAQVACLERDRLGLDRPVHANAHAQQDLDTQTQPQTQTLAPPSPSPFTVATAPPAVTTMPPRPPTPIPTPPSRSNIGQLTNDVHAHAHAQGPGLRNSGMRKGSFGNRQRARRQRSNAIVDVWLKTQRNTNLEEPFFRPA